MTARRRWLPAVVLLALAAGCTDDPPAAPVTAEVTNSAPACAPAVTETGFSVVRQTVQYAIVARNPCPEAIVNGAVAIRVLGPDGQPVAGRDEEVPDVVVLRPGQELAAAGSFFLDKAGTEVGRVEATFRSAATAPDAAFLAWPDSLDVTGVEVGPADSHGRSTVTGRIVTRPAGVGLCAPAASLVLRDRRGAIIYGMTGRIDADRVTFELALPAATDRNAITVAIALGRPALSLDQVATAACAA